MWVNLPDSSIQSAPKEMMFEQIHIDKYGKADRKPFYLKCNKQQTVYVLCQWKEITDYVEWTTKKVDLLLLCEKCVRSHWSINNIKLPTFLKIYLPF